MSQYNTISPIFKEFGFPVLEELMKDKMPKPQVVDDGVVEVVDSKQVEVKVEIGKQEV